MPFRPSTPQSASPPSRRAGSGTVFLTALAMLAFLAIGVSHAEDPFLGEIKEIKCVNCKPGWVTLVVHDPIETRDYELYLKDSDYNKIITPLPGKRILDRNGECFYWLEKPKVPKTGEAKGAPAPPPEATVVPMASKTGAKKPGVRSALRSPDAMAKDSAQAEASMPPESSSVVPPPTPELQGTPSACIRFFRETK